MYQSVDGLIHDKNNSWNSLNEGRFSTIWNIPTAILMILCRLLLFKYTCIFEFIIQTVFLSHMNLIKFASMKFVSISTIDSIYLDWQDNWMREFHWFIHHEILAWYPNNRDFSYPFLLLIFYILFINTFKLHSMRIFIQLKRVHLFF